MAEEPTHDGSERAERIFGDAILRPPEERRGFLHSACAGDEALQREVETLLKHHDEAAGFMERPAPEWTDAAATPTSLHPPDMAAAGDRSGGAPASIGRYRILRRLGSGGMGEVFLAEQENPRREVALKVIRAGVASREALRRFEHEAQILGRLHHPGIAQVHEAGTFGEGDGAQPYFAMEFIRGEPLTVYAKRHGLSERQRLELVARICDAAHHAHLKGVVHRDLKPDNILVSEDGQPRVLDFGVARLTEEDVQITTLHTTAGQIIGTIPYMSPEQIAGDARELDARSDVYALGVILYELLADRPPYDLSRKMIHEAARVIREDEPTRLASINRSLRGDVETIVLKALEKEKERRYQSAAAMASDIRRCLADEPIEARPPSTLYQLGKFARRNRALVGGVAAAFALLLAGVVATSAQAVRATRAEREALVQADEAQRQAAVAKAVADFLGEDIIAMASPEVSPDRELTIRDALDLASAAIDDRDFDSPEIKAAVQREIGRAYLGLTLYAEAMPHFRAVSDYWRSVGLTRRERLDADHLLAATLINTGETVSGGRLYEQTLADALEAIGENDPLTLSIMAGLASYGERLGMSLERRFEFCERSLAGQRRLLGEEHEETLKTMSFLSGLYVSRGDRGTALRLAQEVLDARRRRLGVDHPRTILSIMAVAFQQSGMGELEEAVSSLREAAERAARAIGPDSDIALGVRSTLANTLRDGGRHAEAIELYRDALEGRRRTSGERHFETLHVRNNLSIALSQTGMLEEAEAELALARDGYALTLGDSHLYTIIATNNLADLHLRMGRMDEALAGARLSVDMALESLGELHPTTLRAMNTLAHILNVRGEFSESIPVMQRVVGLMENAYGAADPRTRSTLHYLAMAQLRTERFDDAAANFHSLVERCIDAFGESHIETLNARATLGVALNMAGAFDRAEPVLRTCASQASALLPAHHPTAAVIIQRHGDALAGLGRYDEATNLLTDAYERWAEAEGGSGPNARMLADAAAKVYAAWRDAEPDAGHAERAETWRLRGQATAESQAQEG